LKENEKMKKSKKTKSPSLDYRELAFKLENQIEEVNATADQLESLGLQVRFRAGIVKADNRDGHITHYSRRCVALLTHKIGE
jgi:hypothetical protein